MSLTPSEEPAMVTYDDDRPGMMRVHIADQRARALAAYYTRNGLRAMARARRLPTGGTKHDVAWALASHGVTAPDYDKGTER